MWEHVLLWFPREGTGEARQAGSGLPSDSDFGGLWGERAVPACLVPGPRLTRAGSAGAAGGPNRAVDGGVGLIRCLEGTRTGFYQDANVLTSYDAIEST